MLVNGTQAKNVYWLINGAVSINNYSVFCGTMVVNNGALGALNTGVIINGRTLTTTGALTTTAITAAIPSACLATGLSSVEAGNDAVTIYPDPFTTSVNIRINDYSQFNKLELRIYNALGARVITRSVTEQLSTVETGDLPSGIYFYQVVGDNKVVQSGKLISQR